MLLATQPVGPEIRIDRPLDNVEALRQILMQQEEREVGYDEAREVGNALLDFYQLLAEKVCDESTS